MKIKQFIYSALAAATLVFLIGCNDTDSVDNTAAPTPKVEIKLGSSVAGVEPRAAILPGQSITIQLLGREGTLDAGWSGATQTWTANGTFTTSVTGNPIRIANPQYYNNENADLHTFVLGIYPSGVLQGDKILFSSMNGEQDVMLSAWTDAGSKNMYAPTEGAKTPVPEPASLLFEHCTAQIYFEAGLQNNSSGQGFASPVSLESITLKNAGLPQAVDAAHVAVEFTQTDGLPVPGINAQLLSLTAATCGRPVMVNASGEVRVDIVININGARKLFNDVLITDTDGTGGNLVTQIGKRHKVTLTFQAPEKPADGSVELNVSASIKEWEEGNSGSTTLQ